MTQALRFAVPIKLGRIGNTNIWRGAVGFRPIPVIFQDNGSTFGHLPSVGAFENPTGGAPIIHAEYDRTGHLNNVVGGLSPSAAIASGLDFYDAALFHTSYTERLDNIIRDLEGEQIEYVTPAVNSGSISRNSSRDPSNAYSYLWNSNSALGLEPVFKAINSDAIDIQNRAAFISGIAFGVAGAAAIAVVQELPKELSPPAWWPRRKRRRKPNPEDAEKPS